MHWLNLPKDNAQNLLGFDNRRSRGLNDLMETYHNVECKNVIQRISCLKKIKLFLQDWIKNDLSPEEKPKHLQWLLNMATDKAAYLRRLDDIYTKNLHTKEVQERFHKDVSELYDHTKTPVFLTNQIMFSLRKREYWGDFWMEALDPCHRQMSNYHKTWQDINDTQKPEFLIWLESQNVQNFQPCAEYFEDKSSFKLTVQNGLIYGQKDIDPLSLDSNHRHLYIIDLRGDLYLVKETPTVFHSSLGCGKPVLSAGVMHVENGHVKRIKFESGHYICAPAIGFQTIEILKEKKYTLTHSIEITYFHDRNKYTIDVPKEGFKDKETFLTYISKKGEVKKCQAT